MTQCRRRLRTWPALRGLWTVGSLGVNVAGTSGESVKKDWGREGRGESETESESEGELVADE